MYYAPFGETLMLIHNLPTSQYMDGICIHMFSDKEKDEETGYYYFGARYYDSDLSIWLSVDPLAGKYAYQSPYVYSNNNPIMFVDPDGMKVKAVFDRETQKLYILDLDHYQKGLPIKHVSASEYKLGGMRDKNGNLTHNQVLVISNVFSGGQIENGTIVRDANDSRQKAIPNAIFDILEDKYNAGWFRLDKQDGNPYNDKDDATGRDGFRFHLGGLSFGCVTVDKTQDDAQKSWDVVTSILNSTSTTTVGERRGKQWLNPWSNLTKYGTMEVKGADKIPYKKQEKQ
jgi:RHS repeat-associated protein